MLEEDYKEFFYYAMGCIEAQMEREGADKEANYDLFYKLLKKKQEELLNKNK